MEKKMDKITEIESVIEKYKEYIEKAKDFDVVKTKFGYVIVYYYVPQMNAINEALLINEAKQLEEFIKNDIEMDSEIE